LSLPILTTTPLNIFRLEPYKAGLQQRYSEYKKALNFINQHEGGLDKFSQSYKTMGFQVDDKGRVSLPRMGARSCRGSAYRRL
jgi:hypothetical protein